MPRRTRPPAEGSPLNLDARTRAWIESHVGPVTGTRALTGGISADLCAVDAGAKRWVVKRYVDRKWLVREPDLAVREAYALELLRGVSGVRTPALVAVDGDGAVTGAPSILMTRLAGRHHWVPPSMPQFAFAGVAVHTVDPPDGFRRYRRYHTLSTQAPPSGAVWEDAIAAVRDVDVDAIEPRGFIHRDHHAGNVLWSRGRVSGVVDWVEACEGPLAIDAARARINLVWRAGVEAARAYAAVEGVVVDPVCDVLDALDCLTYGRPDDALLHELDGFIAEALARFR